MLSSNSRFPPSSPAPSAVSAGHHQRALHPLLWCWLWLGLSSLAVADPGATTTGAALLATGNYFETEQRQHYRAAKAALRSGHLQTYRQHYRKLGDYPLKPYLEYSELTRRLHLLPYLEVDRFLDRYEHSYLARQLLRKWLAVLAKRQRWHEFQSYYKPRLGSTELRCQYLQARLNNGEEEALDQVAELWNVGKSQPDACTPLFNAWLKAGGLTPAVAWERHGKALDNRRRALAKYISGLMEPAQQRLAQLYQEVDRYPQRIGQRRRFADQSAEMQEIIQHGIRRYARRDPQAALYQWQRYDAQQLFPDTERSATQQYLATRLARAGHLQDAERLLLQSGNITSLDLIEWLARDALHQQDWDKVYRWLRQLPAEVQRSDRWIYWRARAMEALGLDDPAYPTPRQIYASLALKRSFYGFLSADTLGRDYTLVNSPVDPPRELINAVANLPGIKRARELFELGEIHHARLEWLFATRNLDAPALVASGKLAETWGWYNKGIQAMIAARHWDDLQVRFPLAYRDQMQAAARRTSIAPTLLFAIARQESAFAADVRSPAGALGLMQLMPTTARQTARRAGVRYRERDLLKPEPNITLGSSYLNQLLDQFDGNRILAAAAYNAGPHRVKQWLAKSDRQLPYDIWIETIPFKETRHYVQNVLAFSVIYGHRLGNEAPFITPSEANHRF
ncbi:lytic murein transglycosylase [Exilibacterium tricleocarpae]|uniref:Lytic murein transglycosylase n=1 Tax=Exilibacterium tricleocarpae TaxID=2591008 RepID=A0A545TVY3_9GAMM|nr:transglycosylase SLT domain-containing protein [Exilibacterium tricleocarpae]TQV81373.1 lytic murein transglycosylase [Exilibacterium tricleocarpae]